MMPKLLCDCYLDQCLSTVVCTLHKAARHHRTNNARKEYAEQIERLLAQAEQLRHKLWAEPACEQTIPQPPPGVRSDSIT